MKVRRAPIQRFATLLLATTWVQTAFAQGQLPALPPEPSAPTTAPPPAASSPAPTTSLTTEAAPAAERPASTGATSVSQEQDNSWRYRYGLARERMLAGDFGEAAERFDELSKEARSPFDRTLAESMRDLARSWDQRGLVLVKRNALADRSLPARSVGERTTDEIAGLYTAAAFYGLGTGLWFDVHTDPNTVAGVVVPMVLASGAAVGTVALLDVGHPLKYGVPSSIASGMTLGLQEGLVLALWNQSQDDVSARWSGTAAADVLWGLTTLGAVGGGVLGATLGATPGRAAFVESSGLWAGVVTGFAAVAFHSSDLNRGADALFAADIGMNFGAVGGLLAAGPVSPSVARVSFLNLGAIGGGLLTGALYLAAAGNNLDARAGLGVTALGIAGGVGIAWAATARMPPDRPEPSRSDASSSFHFTPAVLPVAGGAAIGMRGVL